jgi:hypothetical protein
LKKFSDVADVSILISLFVFVAIGMAVVFVFSDTSSTEVAITLDDVSVKEIGTTQGLYNWTTGIDYSDSGKFKIASSNNLSSNTELILDSSGNTYTQQVTVPNAGSTTNYSVGLQILSLNTAGITKQQSWNVVVSPPLPAGVTLSYNLNISIDQLEQRPGGGIIDYATVVKKNGIGQFTTAQTTSSLTPRPFCSPQTQTETDYTEIFPLTMSVGDVVSGTSISQISLDNPANINGCSTLLTQNMTVSLNNVNITGCNCCSASFNQSTATFAHSVGV